MRPNRTTDNILGVPFSWEKQTVCVFCWDREQGTNGEIKREWSEEWKQHIPVCRKHALADGMEGAA